MIDHIKKFGERFGKELASDKDCPVCGEPLFYWKNKNSHGRERITAPVCSKCGYEDMTRRNSGQIVERAKETKRNESINWMKNHSVITDTHAWNYTFLGFKVVDEETRIAKQKAMFWVKQILKGENVHALLTGSPGVGKSHLSYALVNEVMKSSQYQKKCAVVSYRELLEQMKYALNDPEAYKALQGSIIRGLKKADLVVIDDLGAELGLIDNPVKPTPYNLDTLTSLLEARLHKATIFTSNLTSSQLLNLYGERIYSRILNGAVTTEEPINAFRFKTTTDKRKYPIK